MLVRVLLTSCLSVAVGCEREIVALKDSTVGPPVVERFLPSAGLAGQTVVRVEGRDFPSDARVFFGTKQGIFAVGPAYEYTDSVVYAIAPLGTPSLVEIRVRGATGEGESSQLFRVFDGDPQITEIGSERVTPSTVLVIEGKNFNPDDEQLALSLGGATIVDFEVEQDRIVADLGTISNFDEVGTGWKLLRYHFTPFSADGADESTYAVYVTQRSQIVTAERWSSSKGLLRVWVDGFDDYRRSDAIEDTRVRVGTAKAEIVSFEYRDLTALTRPDEGDGRRVQVEALIQLPELASGYYDLTLENLAGLSEGIGFEIVGAGQLFGDATPAPDEALSGLAPVLHMTPNGGGTDRYMATVTSPQESPFVPTGQVWLRTLTGGGDLLYESGIDGSGYPLTVTGLRYGPMDWAVRAVSVHYRQQPTSGTHTLELRYHWWDDQAAAWSQCVLGETTQALPFGLTLAEALDRSRLTADLHVVAPDIDEDKEQADSIVLLTVSGELWNGVFGFPVEISGREFDPGTDTTCPATPVQLSNLVDLSFVGDGEFLTEVAFSPSQRLLYVLPSNGSSSLGRLDAVRVGKVPSATTLAQNGIELFVAEVADEWFGKAVGRLLPTRDGALAFGNSDLFRFRAAFYAGLGATFTPVFMAWPPSGFTACDASGLRAPVALSPNEQELWLTDLQLPYIPAVGSRLARVSATTGMTYETFESIASGRIVSLFYNAEGTDLFMLTIASESYDMPAYSATTQFTQVKFQ